MCWKHSHFHYQGSFLNEISVEKKESVRGEGAVAGGGGSGSPPNRYLHAATRSRMGSFGGLSSRSGFLQPWRPFARINGWRRPRGERGGCESPRADLKFVFRLIQDLPFNLDFSFPNSAECILKLKTSQSPKCVQLCRALDSVCSSTSCTWLMKSKKK